MIRAPLVLVLLLSLCWGCAPLRSRGGEGSIPLSGGMEESRVVFVGEGHTSDRDHAVQLEVLRRLHGSGRSMAIALEMFPVAFQPLLERMGCRKDRRGALHGRLPRCLGHRL